MEGKEKVLVVDDQPMNVKLIATHLLAAGYEVLKAYDGEEALRITKSEFPDIILLDIMMPGIDGYEVTERLKKDQYLSIIPIVLVTALSGIDDKVKGLNAGADDFITKPINQTELLARVRSLIRVKKLQMEIMGKESKAAPLKHIPAKREERGIVLIVEDTEEEAKKLKMILESAGHSAICAKDGNDALATLNEAIPDMILLDMLLPDFSGLDLLGMLRGREELKNTPVIIISAVSDLDIKVRGIENGADDYLVKPVNSLELIARVKTNLHKYEMQKKLRKEADDMFRLSVTDPLTGLYNRNYLKTVLERELEAAGRYNYTFSLMILDIDHFKSVNDTFGHPAGDSVLMELSGIMKRCLRVSDVATRYGGEEFLMVLDHTGLTGARAAAEKLREMVESHTFSNMDGRKVTVSIGVSEYCPCDRIDEIIKRADLALYCAKEEGRNRVRLNRNGEIVS